MKITRSCYSWQGGKFYESPKIIPLMPPHRWYLEVFGGSFTLLINKPKSEFEFGNDKFSCLISFWKCIQNSRLARKLINLMENTLTSRFDYYNYVKMDPTKLSRVDRAYRFLYLTRFGFSSYNDTYYSPLGHRIGKLKNHIQLFKNTGRRLMSIKDRIEHTVFTDFDFAKCLKKVHPNPELFILLDPPYINTHDYSRQTKSIDLSFPEERYIEMRDLLREHSEGGTKFMITCNQENTYFDKMKDIKIDHVERRTCINKGDIKKRVMTKLVMNYDVRKTGSCLNMLKTEDESGGYVMI